MNKFKGLDDEKLRDKVFLYECFFRYINQYRNNSILDNERFLPQNLIKLYYHITNNGSFNILKRSFLEKYIYNESEVEEVHEAWEIKGLKHMYNFAHKYDIEKMDIYTILELHKELYKYAPHPEFGGHFRTTDVYLPGSGTNLSEWRRIRYELVELKPYVADLISRGKKLHNTKDFDKLFKYIEECVILNSNLIRIHPFYDGNGRCLRVFTNMLFELANIPPIYVLKQERLEYREALRKTDVGEYDDLINFYYYKICDSIAELQLSVMKKENHRALKLLTQGKKNRHSQLK